MNFKLNKPCSNCPFRRDCLKGWLGERRAQEIADSIFSNDETFPCHKTTGEDSKRPLHLTTHCAGALLMLDILGHPNWRIRFAVMLKLLDLAALEGKELVFATPEEFVEHHKE